MARAHQSEKAILNETLVAVSALPKTLVFRNNTGMAWQGDPARPRVGSMVRVEPGMVILRNARPIHFGLPGSADILGSTDGRPLAIECKDHNGTQLPSQQSFEKAWVKAGGIYVIVRSVDEALTFLG